MPSDYTPHPLRIQRKMAKGWRMPEDAVYVGRPGKWGNPFFTCKLQTSLVLFQNTVLGYWAGGLVGNEQHRDWIDRHGCRPEAMVEHIRNTLRGKLLACWCPLDNPCHADVLAEIANGGES